MILRKLLLGSAGMLVACGHAYAQQSGDRPPAMDAGAEDQADVVVITGTALNRREAIEEKREDSRTIEALGVDELGQLPDKNVGESLNRLPGVSMLVEKGEGRYVQVRGVASNLNNVTINGVQMGSPEVELGGRQAPLDIISGGVLGGVQVIKTPTPDMDAQGIGGTVNIETKMPFDRPDDLYGYVTARYGYEEVRPEDKAFGGHDPYAVDATLSGKIGDTIGWLVGGSFAAREYVSTGVYQDDWTQVPGQPAGTFLPVNVKNNYYIIGRERLNLNGALQFQPDDNSEYFVRGFYGAWDEFQHRNRYEQNFGSTRVTMTSPTAGTQNTDRILANVRLEYANKVVSSIAAGGKNRFGDITVDYLIQANANEIEEPNDSWEWRSSTTAVGPSTWTLSGDGVVTITPNAGTPDRTNPALLPLRRTRYFERFMTEDALIGQINAVWELSDDLEFKAGLKGSQTERDHNAGQDEFTYSGPGSLNLASQASFNNGGFQNDSGNGSTPNIWMNIDGMNAYFNSNSTLFSLAAGAEQSSDFGSDYSLEEQILAAYGMATWRSGPFEVIGGVRIESTIVDSQGYALGTGTPTAPQRLNASGDYTEVLPALLGNYRPNDELVFRAAITRALGRPDYDSIAPRSTYADQGVTATLSVGNPTLKARKSWNYDFSAEWYPNPLTAIAASVFYKDITDQIGSFSETFTTVAAIDAELARRGITGQTTADLVSLRVSTPTNAGEAYLQGFELSAQSQFEFLPAPFDGLGASVSATFIEGEVTNQDGSKSPLQGQPEQTYGFSAFYQKGPIDASISYAYNASYLTDDSADPNLRLDQGEFGRWDAKVSYTINGDFKIFLEGVNLNDEPTSEFQGGNASWNTEYEYVGRTIYVGATVGF